MPRVYEILARVSLEDRASRAMAALAARALHLEGKIGALSNAFTKLGATTAIVGGGLTAFASVAVLKAMSSVADKGAELLNQQEQLARVAKGSFAEANRITAQYFDRVAKAVPTAEVSEYLKVIRELRGAVGDLNQAEALAPQALKVQALLANSAGGRQDQAFWQLLRGGEMKGIVTDPNKLAAFTEAAVPWFLAQGNKLTPAMFQGFARRAGASWINTDINKSLPAIMTAIGDLSGPTAGQSMMSLYQLMTGTMTLSKQQGSVLESLGMLDMSKITKTGFGGGRLQLGPGAITGSLEHMGDLPGWIRDVLMPAVRKQAGGDKALEESLLAKIFPNRNALRMAMMFGQPGFLEQIQKEKNIAGQVLPLDEAYMEFLRKNPEGAKKAFEAQWNSMWEAIGKPIAELRTNLEVSVLPLLNALGKLANDNPEAIKSLATTIAALAAGLTVLGGAAVIGGLIALAGPAGLVLALATAVTVLAAAHWKEAADGMKLLDSGVESFMKPIREAAFAGLKGLADDLNKLAAALPDFATGVLGKMADWIKSLGDSVFDFLDRAKRYLGFGGVTPGSYQGGGFPAWGGGIIPASYGGYSSSFYGGMGGGGYGGGGGGYSGGMGGPGGGGGSVGPGAMPGLKSAIDAAAAKYGVDPRIMYGIVAGESGGRWVTGDHGMSFGPFQMFTGGGLGNRFEQETGLNVRDPSTMRAQAEWVAKFIAHGGSLGHWHGYHGPRDWLGSAGGSGGFNFMRGQFGAAGTNLTRFTTAGGLHVTAHALAAPHMKGFLEDLERLGAPMQQSHVAAFNNRNIYGSSRLSQHAFGNAIDIESFGRNRVYPAFNAWARAHWDQLVAAENKWGMRSGRAFGDWGHWEWGGGDMSSQRFDTNAHLRRPRQHHTTVHETNIHLDGRVLARHVTRHQVAAATHAHQAPHFDGRRLYSGPDRQVNTG